MPRKFFRAAAVAIASAGTVLAGAVMAPASAAYSSTPSASPNPNSAVFAIARSSDAVFIGGGFTKVGGQSRARLAALNPSSGALLPWTSSAAPAKVDALAVSGGTLFVGGTGFVKAVRISDGGTIWSASIPSGSEVHALHVSGSDLFVGGNFSSINGVSRARLAKLNAGSGSVVTGFNARVTGGRVKGIDQAGTQLVIAGMFTSVGGSARQKVASVSMANGAVSSWAPVMPTSGCSGKMVCYALDITVGAGRAFAAVSGTGGRVVAWNLTSNNYAWTRSGDGDVQAVDFDASSNTVYAGGHFTKFQSQDRDQLVALSASGSFNSAFNPDFPGSTDHPGIWAVLADSYLHIGGGFTTSTGQSKYARFANI